MPRTALPALIALVALLLSACGGGATPDPTVAPMERPTSTPRPTVTPRPAPTEAPEPTDEPEPTEAPAPTPKPISGNGGGELATVVIDGLDEYTHTDGLFTIRAPANWTATDNSEAGVAAVTWSDPTNNALIGVIVTESPAELTQEELAERLVSFVDASRDEPDFSADEPQLLDSGGVQIIWSYTAEADGGVQAKLLVNSFMYQDGDKLSILVLGVPDAQFPDLKESLDEILGSYTIDPSVGLSGVAPLGGDELPDGELYDFSDTKGSWVEEETDAITSERVDGLFRITIKIPNQFYVSNPNMSIGTEQGIAATVEPLGDSRAGVFVRLKREAGKSSYYACWIDAASQWGCFVSVDGEWSTLQDATEDANIIPGAPNRLLMTAYGETLTFSVNGVELLSMEDDRVAEGRAGLYMENFDDTVDATFDDVLIASE